MTALPRSTPGQQQVDARGVLDLLDALARHDVELHSLMVLRHGHVVAEGWWAPYSAERVHLLYSLSKSFTSTAVGLAVAEGLLDLDDTVLSHFPELDAEITDPRSRAIRVRHVAAMASGHTEETLDRAMAVDPVDVLRGFLLTPPDREPGSVFAYNQPCTFSLARIVQRRAGARLTEYLRPRLLDPLGIGAVGWLDHGDDELGFSGLHARTEDIARLGQLYLQRGRWDGRPLLEESWVEQATASHVATDAEPNPDWGQGYGFQFWRSRHGYRGDGAYGQLCLVLPEHDLVVATTAATSEMQRLLDDVWTHLLPAIDRPGTAADGAELTTRLDELQLRPASTRVTDHPDRWSATLPVRAGGPDFPSGLSAVQVQVEDDRVRIGLVEDDSTLRFDAGIGRWIVTETDGPDGPVPVAASAGWSAPDVLAIEVIFLETPHRLDVVCRPTGATATWRTAPLHPLSLGRMRCPR